MAIRFSIIIPLYNKASYIQKALESIVAQTYKEWECIIIDDGSTDESAAVARCCIQRYQAESKIRILSQPNKGVAAARNNGVKAAHNEYICFLDADDWWEDSFLQEMDCLIGTYPDAGLYATNYIYFKPGKTRVALNLHSGYINYPKAYLLGEAMPVCSSAVCIPRSIMDETGGFPENITLGEDFLLWARVALFYPVAFCDKPLAYYNNAVPASIRATCNLHQPEHHMLFHLDIIESGIKKLENTQLQSTWYALLDKLRADGLIEFWISDKYHDAAAVELAKVNWTQLPDKEKSPYKKPIWWLKVVRRMKQTGSYFMNLYYFSTNSD